MKCKVRPDNDTCCGCIDEGLKGGILRDCARCMENQTEYNLVSITHNLFGKPINAVVAMDGKLKCIPIKRIHGVKEA